MPKRKPVKDDDESEDDIVLPAPPKVARKATKSRQTIVFESLPKIECLRDLIDIGATNKFYANIDMLTLWDILPHLIELDDMVGMTQVKKSVFLQVVYYLQCLHTRGEGDYLHTIITGLPGSGKCLAYDTPVIMFDGSIKMVQDIRVGDILMGDDSSPRNVLSLARGTEEMYTVRQSGHATDDYTVNESHILSLKDTADKNTVVDIPLKSYLKLTPKRQSELKGFRVPVYFEVEYPATSYDPYEFGKWLGTTTSSLFQHTFHPLNFLFGVTSSQDYTRALRTPEEIKYGSRHVRTEFINGIAESSWYNIIADGDDDDLGRQSSRHAFDIPLCSQQLAEDVFFIARSLGHDASWDGSKVVTMWNYNITVNSTPDLTCDITVESQGVGDYYGFTLDGNSRFLLGDFTVTHNTTVAKIIGKILKNLNVLSRQGTFKIATRPDLVGQYLGETANKTKKMLNSCIGGVLFIDEVYSLGSGSVDRDSFSKECVDTINEFLSSHKHDFCLIVAGYKEQVEKCFLNINPGLNRRFQWVHEIAQYSNNDLAEITLKMIAEMKWETAISRTQVEELIKANKELFVEGGGSCENLVAKTKLVHSMRVFGKDPRIEICHHNGGPNKLSTHN